MSNFRIVPLSKDAALRIQQARQDSYGNAVLEQTATGYGPCRLTLTAFKPGVDQRLLFAYSPFNAEGLYAEKGPVFISATKTEPYADLHRFPPQIKADPVNFPLSLLGYSADNQMVFTKLVGVDDIDDLLSETLNNHPEIVYLHVRNSEACCYICAVERA